MGLSPVGGNLSNTCTDFDQQPNKILSEYHTCSLQSKASCFHSSPYHPRKIYTMRQLNCFLRMAFLFQMLHGKISYCTFLRNFKLVQFSFFLYFMYILRLPWGSQYLITSVKFLDCVWEPSNADGSWPVQHVVLRQVLHQRASGTASR